MSQILGQQVIVENIGGAGNTIGANRVAKALADGYQFLIAPTGTFAQSQSLFDGHTSGDVAWKVSIKNPMQLNLVFSARSPATSMSGDMVPLRRFPLRGTKA